MKTPIIDNKVIQSSVLAGLLGGGLLTFIFIVDFGLGYLGGYALFLTYILTLYFGRIVYKTLETRSSTHFKRVIVGFLTYSIMTFVLTVVQMTFRQFNINGSVTNYALITLIHIVFGLTLSLLFALRRQSRVE